jgi:hypothetical protein
MRSVLRRAVEIERDGGAGLAGGSGGEATPPGGATMATVFSAADGAFAVVVPGGRFRPGAPPAPRPEGTCAAPTSAAGWWWA